MTERGTSVDEGSGSTRYHLLMADGGIVPDQPGKMAGEAAIAVVLKAPLEGIAERIGPVKDHHVAEYRALIRGLEAAQSHGIRHLRVCLDSKLVVNQLTASSRVEAEHLKPLYDQAVSLMNQFADIEITWVPREANAEADALSGALLGPLRLKPKSAPDARRRTSRTAFRELAPDKLAAHLLAHYNIPDRAWTDEPRLPGETRTAFIHRVLLGET
jgi:ribonuclease HI